MEYNKDKKEIISNKELSKLDKLALNFTSILEKYAKYIIVSGYISILLGRARATEDIDIFIERIEKERFFELYEALKKAGFWCINAEKKEEIYNYLAEKLPIRFALEGKAIPNFEVKFIKENQEDVLDDIIKVKLKQGILKISSLERQIAFKRYYLKSEKDKEDALHIENLFGEKLDYNKINKLKELIKNYEK